METSGALNSNLQNPLILSVETATLAGSVSLSRGEEVLVSLAGDSGVSHSNTLLHDIDRLMRESRIDLPQIDLFAVASGPGSFTGLRIGLATIKALSATLDRPCVGIPTLEAVAHAAGPSPRSVALLPAGRGEVFAQMFSVSGDGFVTALDQATHISPQRLLERYGSLDDIRWCGEGAVANKAMIEKESKGQIVAAAENLSVHIASLALARFLEQRFDRPDALQAIYVRPSDAELKA